MSFRVSNLRLPVEEPEANLPAHLARALGLSPTDLGRWRIVRKALDLRDKQQLRFVYNFEVDLPDVTRAASGTEAQVELVDEPPFAMPPPGTEPLPNRPVVVGSGPGGLVCAYFLALHGYRPLLLERGTKVNDRIRDVQRFDAGGPFHPESNYLFGEGGAGTFSDGKLTCRGTGPDVMRVLELFAECKGQQPGKPSIRDYHRPHLGSNRPPAVGKALRRRIAALGGDARFTLCMRAGGYIIPSVSAEGYFCTNGMSLSKRDSPFANSGLVVTIPVEEFGGTDVLAGVRLQERYERKAFELGKGEYKAPVQRATDFLGGRAAGLDPAAKTSYPRGVVPCDLREVLPPVVIDALRHG